MMNSFHLLVSFAYEMFIDRMMLENTLRIVPKAVKTKILLWNFSGRIA